MLAKVNLSVVWSAPLRLDSSPLAPVARLPVLVRDGVDPRATGVFFIHHGVGKTIEVVHAKSEVDVRTSGLVFDEEVCHALELGEERFGDCEACVLGLVDGGVTQLSFRVGVNPAVHASRALTLARAAAPGTILARPECASSRRRRASSSQAA